MSDQLEASTVGFIKQKFVYFFLTFLDEYKSKVHVNEMEIKYKNLKKIKKRKNEREIGRCLN